MSLYFLLLNGIFAFVEQIYSYKTKGATWHIVITLQSPRITQIFYWTFFDLELHLCHTLSINLIKNWLFFYWTDPNFYWVKPIFTVFVWQSYIFHRDCIETSRHLRIKVPLFNQHNNNPFQGQCECTGQFQVDAITFCMSRWPARRGGVFIGQRSPTWGYHYQWCYTIYEGHRKLQAWSSTVPHWKGGQATDRKQKR